MMHDGVCVKNFLYIGILRQLHVYSLDTLNHISTCKTLRLPKRIIPLWEKYLLLIFMTNQWIEVYDLDKAEIITSFNISGSMQSTVYDAVKLDENTICLGMMRCMQRLRFTEDALNYIRLDI
jgi:hypothetical protein